MPATLITIQFSWLRGSESLPAQSNAYNKGLDNSFFDGCKDPNNPSSDQLLPLL